METLRSFIVNRRGILYNQNKWQIPAVHNVLLPAALKITK